MATTNHNLIKLANERFGAYAKYIILNRALPDIRDGLKPVQRRILYAMYQLHLWDHQPYKKSARVVGDVIGKYHPHGDSSIYEALVRMAQDWKMNIPLVDMHGNKGSIDDDPAAAMRYTEVRLAPISRLILERLKAKIVPMQANFDDSEVEPVVLPTMFANLLINGAKGIAAGYATEIAPHNLNEVYDALVALIKNPKVRNQTLMNIIKGPDFPTGAIIHVDQEQWEQIMTRGTGKITISARATITNKQIIIDAIGYQIIKSKLVAKLETLASEQAIGIKAINDHSDRHGIKIVIDLEANAYSQKVWNYLLAKTECQINYHYNIVAIANGSPQQLGLRALLEHYLAYLQQLEQDYLRQQLDQAQSRLNIVEGLISAHLISDQVIKCIRQTNGGKQAVIDNLVKQLKFNYSQAQAISELMLYRLGKTDLSIYEKEARDLNDLIAANQTLLNDQNQFNQWLIKQLQAIKKTYGNARKSVIATTEGAIAQSPITSDQLVAASNLYVGISAKGMIKRISPSAWKGDYDQYGLLAGDRLVAFYQATTNDDLVIFFASGHYAILNLNLVPLGLQKATGIRLDQWLKDYANQSVIGAIIVKNRDYENLATTKIAFVSAKGMGKLVNLKQMQAIKQDRLLKAFKFKNPDDYLISAIASSKAYDQLTLLTKAQTILRIDLNQVATQSLVGTGVLLIKMKGQDHLISALVHSAKKPLVFVHPKGKTTTLNSGGQIPKTNRATQGSKQFLKNLNLKQAVVAIADPLQEHLIKFQSGDKIDKSDQLD